MLITKKQLESFTWFAYRLCEDGKLDDAAKLFRGLTMIAQESHYGHTGLAAVALAKADPDEALGHLSTALELNPDDPAIHATLGEAYLRKGLQEAGRKELRYAVALDPDMRNQSARRARAILSGQQRVAPFYPNRQSS